MAAPMLRSRLFCSLLKFNRQSKILENFYSTSGSNDPPGIAKKHEQSGVLKAFSKFEKIIQEQKTTQQKPASAEEETGKVEDNETFRSMLRKSKLFQLGEPRGNVLSGEVIEVFENDLYIDFGGKFHCVCKRPEKNPELYHRGTRVKIMLKDFEMTSSFLGSAQHITLLEADGVLLGLDKKADKKEATRPEHFKFT